MLQAMRKRLIALHLHHSPLPSSSTSQAVSKAEPPAAAAIAADDFSIRRGVELLVEYLEGNRDCGEIDNS